MECTHILYHKASHIRDKKSIKTNESLSRVTEVPSAKYHWGSEAEGEALVSDPCSKAQHQHLDEHTEEPLPLSPPFPNGPVLQIGQAEGWWAWPMATGHSQ